MTLQEYRRKRHFERTPEPSGGDDGDANDAEALRFVVQKHAASRLHYDFRLELDGVLKSWAVPKGPSYRTNERRLAVHVEDHPLEYGEFEGVIPEGEYGGGSVQLWDRGRWTPQGDVAKGYRSGRLKFILDGEKLRGRWTLVRMQTDEGDRNWLLIKERDEYVRSADEPDIVDEAPLSVVSGRTVEEIGEDRDRVWDSERGELEPTPRTSVSVSEVAGARRGRLPTKLEPQLATLVTAAPAGDEWVHEIKFDGYRLLCRIDGDAVRLYTRSGKDWSSKFGAIGRAAQRLNVERALLDGEVVALNESGVSDFQTLQQALSGTSPLHYYAFDLIHLDGYDLARVPLAERKALLSTLLAGRGGGVIRYSDDVRGEGPAFFRQACDAGVEGIISKRADRPYRPGRGRDWLKVKCVNEQEFVVVGFTEPSGSRAGLGALVLGVNESGELRYCGRVGTGFDEATLLDLRARLDRLTRKTPPVANPPGGAAGREVRWVRPELVAVVSFTEWTGDGVLRHPVYKGLREDKRPEAVVREKPVESVSESKSESKSKSKSKSESESEFESESGSGVGRGAGKKPSLDLSGLKVRLTSPEKALYPAEGITKADLAAYYAYVAAWILPHLRDRPLTLVRCPQGMDGECFYQKHAKEAVPDVVGRVRIKETDKTEDYLYVDTVEGLISLVQIGALEIHVWNARRDRVERPDQVVMDLDPGPSVPWDRVIEGAFTLRDRLGELGLQSFPKTTGGKGLHVVVPLSRRTGWEAVKAFARALAEERAAEEPKRYTSNVSKAERKGRIYVDYLRNGRGATAITPYSTRARPGATVAVPVSWDELATGPDPQEFTLRTVPHRLESIDRDPWDGFGDVRQSITAAVRRELGLA